MTAPPTNIVDAQNLVMSYGDTRALDGMSFQVRPGEIVCLLGANGAGKSTLLHVLLGFLRPSSGTATILGVDVARDPVRARASIGYLPEVVQLYPLLTATETIEYFEQLGGRRRDPERARRVLSRVGLPEAALDRRVASLSKGMRQKVGLAIAVAKSAQVLFLDEPMSGLDPASANELVALLQQLASDGVAVVMVTHDIFRAHQLGGRVGIMRHGKLIEDMTATAISANEIERLYVHHLRDVA